MVSYKQGEISGGVNLHNNLHKVILSFPKMSVILAAILRSAGQELCAAIGGSWGVVPSGYLLNQFAKMVRLTRKLQKVLRAVMQWPGLVGMRTSLVHIGVCYADKSVFIAIKKFFF